MNTYFTISVQETLDGDFVPVCNFKIGDAIQKFISCEEAVDRVRAMVKDPTPPHPIKYRIDRVTTEEVWTITDEKRLADANYWQSVAEKAKDKLSDVVQGLQEEERVRKLQQAFHDSLGGTQTFKEG